MEIVELPEGDIAAPCDCGDACDAPGAESITLTVLGPGCKRCHQLNDNAQAAASKVPCPLLASQSSTLSCVGPARRICLSTTAAGRATASVHTSGFHLYSILGSPSRYLPV